jgi:enamine deaminase RidA (YjgF/YER057c/UK114 family)
VPDDERRRRSVTSASIYEERFGYSRAIRDDRRVVVSGTAPIWPDGHVDPDPAVQARRCLEIIETALSALGARRDEVVRTRIYLVDLRDAEIVGAVHGEFFARVKPAATMVVVAGLLDARWRVEIEAEAQLSG